MVIDHQYSRGTIEKMGIYRLIELREQFIAYKTRAFIEGKAITVGQVVQWYTDVYGKLQASAD